MSPPESQIKNSRSGNQALFEKLCKVPKERIAATIQTKMVIVHANYKNLEIEKRSEEFSDRYEKIFKK